MPVLLGVSLKLYLDVAASTGWARSVAAAVRWHPAVVDGHVRLFALPSLPALPDVRAEFAGTPVEVGAQNLHWADRGAFTGEVSGVDLREVGCTFVEIGHAERRQLFGESDDTVRRKLVAAVRNGLTPVLCVGEDSEVSVDDAVALTIGQLASALTGLQASSRADIVVAYEPVWAIGGSRPAGTGHVAQVVDALRRVLAEDPRILRGWVIYGGSARPGSLSELGNTVDGLFLGRFAHDPAEFVRVVDEAALLARR